MQSSTPQMKVFLQALLGSLGGVALAAVILLLAAILTVALVRLFL